MPEQDITINIAGVCVLRDTFGLHENDGGYKIKKYTSAFAPLYITDPPFDIEYEKYLKVTQGLCPKFTTRCVYMELTKTSIDWVLDERSDYLLVDMGLFRMDYFQLGNGQLYFGEYKNLCIFESLSKQGIIPEILGETKPFDDFSDEELKKRLQIYFSKILEVYPVEKIILVEIKNIFEKVDLNNYTISNFKESSTLKAKRQNVFMQKCFEYSKEILKGCHIIYFPDNVLGDENHHLMPAHMHYTQEYYDYVLKAVDVICREKLSHKEEVKKLKGLRNSCSKKYKILKKQMTVPSPQMQNWIKKKNSDHRLERNAMNFCFEVMMDSLNNDDSLFFKYVRSLRGKDIAVLSSADRAGQIFSKAAESSGANVVFLSSKAKLQLLTDEEFAQCQQCDVVISCDVHGVKTHIYNGIKCLNIWDILRDRSLTDNLPSSIVNCE